MLREITPGVRRWTAPHPEWRPRHPWAAEVASFAVVAGEDLLLVDPLVEGWAALDELVEGCGARRLAVLITIHYHERSAAEVRERYRDRLPVTVHGRPFEAIGPDDRLPGGARAFRIGSPRRSETPILLPSVRALAFGDTVVGVDGELRVWESMEGGKSREWYERRFLPTLRPLLELDFDNVLVTHGPPVLGNGRELLARALDAPPWHYRAA